MNQREMEKHIVFQVSFIIFLIFTIAFTIFWLLTDNVNASDYHNVVTNAIYTGTTHCSTNQTGLCVSDTSSTSYSRYTFGSNSYQNTLSINFWLNTSVRKNVNATIRLTGKNWANVNYTCQTNYFTDCRVVRASSTILNINFSNDSNGVSGVEFFITANGSILNTNDLFYVQKADLYETNIVDDDSQNTQDVINNQNQNTQDIIDNNNSNTQDIIESNIFNFNNLIDKNKDNFLASLNQERSQLVKMCTNAYDTPLKLGKTLSITDGSLINRENAYYTEDYINIDFLPGTKTRLYIENPPNSVSGYILVAYDSNKHYLGRVNTATRGWVFPTGTQFFRFSSPVPNTLITANTKCVTSDDAINNYLQDDSNPSVDDSAISDTLESVAIDDPLNYLLTLPFHAIQRINYQLGRNSCEPINLGSLYGTDLIFPCINVKEKLGTSLFNLIDTLMGIGILSVTLKKFYDSISNVLTLGKEKEVREKLELPTPMEFLAMIFGGGR